jgi:hypothetical protein
MVLQPDRYQILLRRRGLAEAAGGFFPGYRQP